jgi:uncharacterized protein involved in propanediol utilization
VSADKRIDFGPGRTGIGACNGSFGELLQGVLPGNQKFLVNLKIKRRSHVTVNLSSCQYFAEKESRYADSYKCFSKSYKLLRNLLSDLECHDDYFIDVDSDIPIGKGLSSSTADMIATMRGLEKAMSISLKNEYVSKMLTEIEPNDGLHHPGTSAYHHTTGRLIGSFDYIPPLHILGLDLGGVVDTVAFNAVPRVWQECEMEHYESMLTRMTAALNSKDVNTICSLATESTILWQNVSPKAELEKVLNLASATGALGVLNTHSGSYLGLLYDRSKTPELRAELGRKALSVGGFKSVDWFETITVGSDTLEN